MNGMRCTLRKNVYISRLPTEAVEMLTTTEVAERFRVGRSTVTAWIRGGLLPATQDGERGSYLVASDHVAAFRRPTSTGKPPAAPVGPLGERIAARMAELGINQTQLAQATGVHQSRISEILRGRVTSPGVARLAGLAKALQTTTSALLGETPHRSA